MSNAEDHQPVEPPPGAPDMDPPTASEPAEPEPPEPEPAEDEPAEDEPSPPVTPVAAKRFGPGGLLAAISFVAVLAVAAAAAFVLFGGDDETAGPVGENLTEGLDPFEPDTAEGYFAFAAEQDMWIPLPEGDAWSHEDVGDAGATFHKTAGDDTVILICGDIEPDGPYPDDVTDRVAWFAAEDARDRAGAASGDRYSLLEGPDYTDYVIDGRQAFLVEVQHHWTQRDNPESGPEEVDYTRAHAYLYVDRGELAPVRCSLTAHDGVSAGYGEGLEAMLRTRAEASSAAD